MIKKRNSSFIDFFIEFIYLTIIFLLPLYFSPFFITENIFGPHKMAFFRIFLFIFVFLSLVKFFYQSKFKKIFFDIFKKYFYLILILVIFSLISVFWSLDPSVSFYGTAIGQIACLDQFYFFLFFVFLVLNLVFSKNKEKKIKGLLVSISLSSLLVSLYALAQSFGYDFIIRGDSPLITQKVISTLGQSNFLASFLLLSIPFSIYLINKSKNFYLQIFYSLVFLFQFLALISSGNRSAYLVFILSTPIFLFFAFLKNDRKKFFLGIALTATLTLALLFSSFALAERFQSAFNIQEGDPLVRLNVWSPSFKSLAERSWGYGLANQKEATINNYNSEWAVFNEVNVVSDRAYNIILDLILEIGIIGLALWTCFYVFVFKLLFKNIGQKKHLSLSVAIFWALGAYLIFSLFSSSSIVSSVYFWTLVALTVYLHYDFDAKEDLEEEACNLNNKTLKILVLIIFFFVCVLGINNEIKRVEADYYFSKTKEYFYSNEIPAALVTFSYLRDLNIKYRDYHYAFVEMNFNNFNHFRDESSRFLAKEELKEVLQDLEGSSRKNSFEHSLSKARVLILLERFDEAEDLLEKLKERSPYYPDIYFVIAKKELFEGKTNLAIDKFKEVLALLPESDDVEKEKNKKSLQIYKYFVHREIADAYFNLEDYSSARDHYFKAYNNNLKDVVMLNDIAETYYQEKSYPQVIFYNKHGIKKASNNYIWYFSLAKVYHSLEDDKVAFDYLKIAEKLSPNNLRIKNFSDKIKE
jgi:tetratricopeptide (TPR) repeat protein/O-antigen ligase